MKRIVLSLLAVFTSVLGALEEGSKTRELTVDEKTVAEAANAYMAAYNLRDTKALAAIRIADSEEAMLRALASIPGTPSNLSGTFKAPLPQVRRQLLNQIEPQLNARQTQFNALQGERWQQGILRWIKDALVALFSAIGLAAIGRSADDRPTLLEITFFPELRHVRRLDPSLQQMADESELIDSDIRR